jgi:hypothetical protein
MVTASDRIEDNRMRHKVYLENSLRTTDEFCNRLAGELMASRSVRGMSNLEGDLIELFGGGSVFRKLRKNTLVRNIDKNSDLACISCGSVLK